MAIVTELREIEPRLSEYERAAAGRDLRGARRCNPRATSSPVILAVRLGHDAGELLSDLAWKHIGAASEPGELRRMLRRYVRASQYVVQCGRAAETAGHRVPLLDSLDVLTTNVAVLSHSKPEVVT